jgi:ADP-ribosylglycohydrolase
MTSELTKAQRIAGGIWGLLIGDALGVPYEFHAPENLPAKHQLEMQPPAGFRRAHASVPIGTWSDDGAQALALLASLQSNQGLHLDDFANRLINWYEHGYMAVDYLVFDVGIQSATAIRKLVRGIRPETAGGSSEYDNGNGSLMRVLPLALCHQGSDEELVYLAQQQSLVTHAHLRSQLCCALCCLWARYLLKADEFAWEKAVSTLRQIYPENSAAYAELEFYIRPDDEPMGKGTGYVVDSLRSARMLLKQEHSYEAVVKAAIALGHDTDTTACIAGGLAGIKYGVDAIPERWMQVLRGKDLVEPLLDELLR